MNLKSKKLLLLFCFILLIPFTYKYFLWIINFVDIGNARLRIMTQSFQKEEREMNLIVAKLKKANTLLNIRGLMENSDGWYIYSTDSKPVRLQQFKNYIHSDPHTQSQALDEVLLIAKELDIKRIMLEEDRNSCWIVTKTNGALGDNWGYFYRGGDRGLDAYGFDKCMPIVNQSNWYACYD